MRFSEVRFCDSMMYYAYTQNVVCVKKQRSPSVYMDKLPVKTRHLGKSVARPSRHTKTE